MDDHTVMGRVLEILEAIQGTSGPTTLAMLAAETGIPKPTVRRIANNLVVYGILQHSAAGYDLGLRLVELGSAAVRQATLADVASPYLQELSERTRQISWIGVVSADSLVVADFAYTPAHAKIMASEDGRAWIRRMPRQAVPSTAAGRMLFAIEPGSVESILRAGAQRLTPYTATSPKLIRERVSRAAETGIAVEYEECRLGWWCAAMQVPGPTRNHVIGLTAQTNRLEPARGLRQLQQIADRLERELAVRTA